MENKKLAEEIGATSYPGRGIVIGLTPDGKKAAIAYFIMGRSSNSRNRVFVEEGRESRLRHLTLQSLKIQVLSSTHL